MRAEVEDKLKEIALIANALAAVNEAESDAAITIDSTILGNFRTKILSTLESKLQAYQEE